MNLSSSKSPSKSGYLPPMKLKGSAKVVEAKDISPAWKVLQMKLSEEKSTKEETEPTEKKPKQKPQQQSRKRRMQEALAETAEPAKKTRNAPPKAATTEASSVTPSETTTVAIDCEYVGGGQDGNLDLLARVSVVNLDGDVIYDKYVKPSEKVTDYRTVVSGIRPADLLKGMPFQTIQMETAKLLKDKKVIGHAIHNDFRVLNLTHNRTLTRDTAKCPLLREMAKFNGRGTPSLKVLAKNILDLNIQQGEHDSITDARVALRLYLSVKKPWEAHIKRFHKKH